MTTLPASLSNLSINEIFEPTLLIDKEALAHNLGLVNQHVRDGFNTRLVVKSLPSLDLLKYVAGALGTQRFMCFHVPFIKKTALAFPASDILLGKPIPASAFEHLCEWFNTQPTAQIEQVQWLVDSPKRLSQYLQICERLDINIRVSLEINIGLQRGGFANDKHYVDVLNTIKASSRLTLSGLMGYEAHASKIPKAFGGLAFALKESQREYSLFKTIAQDIHPEDDLCFNTGGSTTFTAYIDKSPANELSLGSALLKPSDFDLPTLSEFQAAIFIVTPVLKRIDQVRLPGPKSISSLLSKSKLTPTSAIYIYGGNWLAQPFHPKGIKHNALFGRSSNQELYSVSADSTLQADDLVFFRPSQSEAVLLQFGDIGLATSDGIHEWWSPLNCNESVNTPSVTTPKES